MKKITACAQDGNLMPQWEKIGFQGTFTGEKPMTIA